MLDLQHFNVINADRCRQVFPETVDWTLNDWMTAAAGELGEACNVAKKIRRGDYDDHMAQGKLDLATELADAITYISLVATFKGIDLEAALVEKFNYVSRERKSTYFL